MTKKGQRNYRARKIPPDSVAEDNLHEGRDGWGGPGEFGGSYKMKRAAAWGEGKKRGYAR